jgi:hypothetical protein
MGVITMPGLHYTEYALSDMIFKFNCYPPIHLT